MSSLIDIKETDFGIDSVTEYVISRAKNSDGEDFSITIPGIVGLHGPGASITIKDISALVTQKEYNAGPEGYTTTISGIGKIADAVRKAPTKTLMYMSMTTEEYEEFKIANMDDNGQIDFSFLEYRPMIRICDSKTFMGGWDCHTVVKDLASRMGLQTVCNVRNFWLRQVQADVSASFFDTIMSVISFLRPTVYIDGNVLYLINKPLRGGSASFAKVGQFSQVENYNRQSKASYMKFSGGLGAWLRQKVKGRVEAETEITLTNTVGSTTARQLTHFAQASGGGGTRQLAKWLGSVDDGREINVERNMPIADETTTTEVYRVDPFGNNKALLSRHVVTMNSVIGPAVKTHENLETYEYDFLGEEFDRPRMTKKTSVVGEYAWQVTTYGGSAYAPIHAPIRQYRAKISTIEESYIYAPNGSLLAEVLARTSECLKFGDYLTEAQLTNLPWITEGESEEHGVPYVSAVVEEKIVRYRQINKDMYQKMTYHKTLGGARRLAGDGVFNSSSEQIKGRVPKHPRSYRHLNVYAENVPVDDGVMDVPAVEVGSPNVVSWVDAENILFDLKRDLINFEHVVTRRYTIPADIPIDIGWSVDFGSLQVGASGIIPSASVQDSQIKSWQKTKNGQNGTVQTVVTIEGKVLA